jgi:hypothetical protein
MILGWFAGAVAVVAVGAVVFWPLTDLIASHDVGAIAGADRGAALQAARDAARGRLVGFGAGLFAAGALVYTARNFSLSRQGQVTDRYTKAIGQLGDDELDVRIGGIYALERIARDSRRDHPTIMEVLAAFVRDHSGEQWPPAEPSAEPPERTTRPDVQAAATVIGRRTAGYDSRPISVDGAHLTKADLAGADFTRVTLKGTDLTGADLKEAILNGANLTGADLRGANLGLAHLTKANFEKAILADANLDFAHLAGATFHGADLTRATFVDADLTGAFLDEANLTSAYLGLANLTRADLTDANLTDANFTHATWPPDARVPEGWHRDTDSGRLNRADNDWDCPGFS